MTARDSAGEIVARPPEPAPAAALPFEAHDGAATVSVAGAAREASVVDDSLGAVIRRLALPAVASNVLMTVFASADAYWVGKRIGARGLAAVDIVAEIDDDVARCLRGIGVLVDRLVQRPQQVDAAVNVADRVDARAVGDARRHRFQLRALAEELAQHGLILGGDAPSRHAAGGRRRLALH